jgi:hypothetical protein
MGLGGCSDDVQQVRASDVTDRTFAFASGAVFNAALSNMPTTLTFSNNAANFTLSSANGTASGTNTFGSCTLTVTSSTYGIGAGPQQNDAIRLDPCDFDIPQKVLLVGNGLITASSSPGVAVSAAN